VKRGSERVERVSEKKEKKRVKWKECVCEERKGKGEEG